MNMIKELAKNQENRSLAKFALKTTEHGRYNYVSPEKYADRISEQMTKVLKENLRQQGFTTIVTK